MTPLLNTSEASAYLTSRGVAFAAITLRKRRTTHPTKPTFKKIGGRIRYTTQALDAFMDGVSP